MGIFKFSVILEMWMKNMQRFIRAQIVHDDVKVVNFGRKYDRLETKRETIKLFTQVVYHT